jgi:hypothetical protein
MKRRLVFVLVGAVAVAACSDSTAPPDTASDAPHHLRWATSAGPRASKIIQEAPQAGLGGLTSMNATFESGPQRYSIWAVRGETRTLQIDFPEPTSDGDSLKPFLSFTIPPGALSAYPDGTPFVDGDSVLITATVDEELFVIDLGPTGLTFTADSPAQLRIWYTGADEDFDADGDVDSQDAYIDSALLGIWYHELQNDPWSEIGATRSLLGKWFEADLLHFSTYAVSW